MYDLIVFISGIVVIVVVVIMLVIWGSNSKNADTEKATNVYDVNQTFEIHKETIITLPMLTEEDVARHGWSNYNSASDVKRVLLNISDLLTRYHTTRCRANPIYIDSGLSKDSYNFLDRLKSLGFVSISYVEFPAVYDSFGLIVEPAQSFYLYSLTDKGRKYIGHSSASGTEQKETKQEEIKLENITGIYKTNKATVLITKQGTIHKPIEEYDYYESIFLNYFRNKK
jgi:hypothetical protein